MTESLLTGSTFWQQEMFFSQKPFLGWSPIGVSEFNQPLRNSFIRRLCESLSKIQWIWGKSNLSDTNPIHTLSYLWNLLLFVVFCLYLSQSFSPRRIKWTDINSIHKFLELLPGHISWLLYFVLVTNNQGKWSLWEIFRFQLSDDRWWNIMERALFKRMLIEW